MALDDEREWHREREFPPGNFAGRSQAGPPAVLEQDSLQSATGETILHEELHGLQKVGQRLAVCLALRYDGEADAL